MLKRHHIFIQSLVITGLLLVSCSKGYKVRVSNYSTEAIDSVVIGNNKLVLTEIQLEQTTDLYNISKGSYSIAFITKSKKRFYSSMFISGKGQGQRTIQIDGLNQISILEE